MEDQIIGAVLIIVILAIVGIGSHTKRRWGENAHDAKYGRKQ